MESKGQVAEYTQVERDILMHVAPQNTCKAIVLCQRESFNNSFPSAVKARGMKLYNDGKVWPLVKAVRQKEFVSLVRGEKSGLYRVHLFFDDYSVGMTCTCRSHGCCEHELAMLAAVDMDRYDLIDFKPFERDGMPDIAKMVMSIPPEALAMYVTMNLSHRCVITPKTFVRDFKEVIPAEPRNRIYNIIYNEILVSRYLGEQLYLGDKNRPFMGDMSVIDRIMIDARRNMERMNWRSSFKIVSAMVDAAVDLGEDTRLFSKYKLDQVLARTYHFASAALVTKMDKWAQKYRDDIYLGDRYLQKIIQF
jgi:hypothetical protein